jgi:hypothetical protein
MRTVHAEPTEEEWRKLARQAAGEEDQKTRTRSFRSLSGCLRSMTNGSHGWDHPAGI